MMNYSFDSHHFSIVFNEIVQRGKTKKNDIVCFVKFLIKELPIGYSLRIMNPQEEVYFDLFRA